ncbi:hypothetical protein [Geotalea uraniireducens]|uniref:Uncharacterized protein n=1 Tax=Geotalea uraniireducens (strain Rf4) TaxID=351605 RepID=A5G6B0_GEOUR|nr:hypothetical protein [Geotalea uraniireducens]ABQ27328.1 hypothetical protein Gura_3167 [Geotalea uraniireducens Rf4]
MRLDTILEKILLQIDDVKKLSSISDALSTLKNAVEGRIRQSKLGKLPVPAIASFDNSELLTHSILQYQSPWQHMKITTVDIPGMISQEECRYYAYIGKFYSGRGALVELGPWLGRSTYFIVEGLKENPNFTDKKLHVIDDFVWRSSWMNDKVPPSEQLDDHQDFQFLFDRYSASFCNLLTVEKRRISLYDGNEAIPLLTWNGSPIEILYVDCGRTFDANQAWYEQFCHSFIPGKTLIILQDWGRHREVPVQWFNQIKQFIDSKAEELQLVHELRYGDIATFLFTGK